MTDLRPAMKEQHWIVLWGEETNEVISLMDNDPCSLMSNRFVLLRVVGGE